MITIEDKDMPIVCAYKIINGSRPYLDFGIQDQFSLEEIKEIAEYLLVYYNSHREEEGHEHESAD